MTIAQTERPSYRSKKNYAKFGTLHANMDLNMHEKNLGIKKYEYKKVNSKISNAPPETIKSNSLVRITNLKKNIQKKKEIKEKLNINEERQPITIKKSKQKIFSKKGGEMHLNAAEVGEMTLLEKNEVKEFLRNGTQGELGMIWYK